jgi:hypothetical protein
MGSIIAIIGSFGFKFDFFETGRRVDCFAFMFQFVFLISTSARTRLPRLVQLFECHAIFLGFPAYCNFRKCRSVQTASIDFAIM